MSDPFFEELRSVVEKGEGGALATVVRTSGSTPRRAGAKMLVRPDGTTTGTICGGCVEAEVYSEAQQLMDSTRTKLMTFHLSAADASELGMKCGGSMEVFIEPLPRENGLE